MKVNKEKTILTLLILFQISFIGYELFKNNNKDFSILKTSNNNKSSHESNENNNINKEDLKNTKPISDLSNNKVDTNASPKEEGITKNIDNKNSNLLKSITIESYMSNISTESYTIKSGDTISNILRKFEDTCNYMTGYKYLRILNPNTNLNDIEINSVINIPYNTFSSGKLYSVKSGDTWYKLIKDNYPEYDIDDFSKFLIYINNLPNSDLPLGENIFLPAL